MKGWKTILFGALVAVASALLSFLEGLKQTLGECGVNQETAETVCSLPGWVGFAVGGAIIALRFLTTTPVFKK